jgi:protein phosphatase
LIHLPPTMSPVATSNKLGFLEHPTEAFAYYQQAGVATVICEEKHMGSRTVAIVCRDRAVAGRRFGVVDEGIGIFYTRTGRRFFNDAALETELLARLNAALTQSDFWQRFQTDWVCLDCELMPWSVKAQGLIRQQYAAVGTAANHALESAIAQLNRASDRGIEVSSLIADYQQRQQLAHQYVNAYQRYCWNVEAIADLKLAPFHILATEGKVHIDRTHLWHMQEITQICNADPEVLLATEFKVVELDSKSETVEAAIAWWEELTANGGEGMVVKPLEFVSHANQSNQLNQRLNQPAVKCRGQAYLQIIYGPEYLLPHNLERLRQRGLSLKRSLALREFALGIEALERFVSHAPLRQVHECVFGVLALESAPIDPRL